VRAGSAGTSYSVIDHALQPAAGHYCWQVVDSKPEYALKRMLIMVLDVTLHNVHIMAVYFWIELCTESLSGCVSDCIHKHVTLSARCNCYLAKTKLLPPVNWRWVKEGDGYVRHEAWPHTPTVGNDCFKPRLPQCSTKVSAGASTH
jgi:hypothetical protein